MQRNHVGRVLRKNPGLKLEVDGAITKAYETARIEAASQTSLEEDEFLVDCPYSWDENMEHDIPWPTQD